MVVIFALEKVQFSKWLHLQLLCCEVLEDVSRNVRAEQEFNVINKLENETLQKILLLIMCKVFAVCNIT
jgi:hypothetical protein